MSQKCSKRRVRVTVIAFSSLREGHLNVAQLLLSNGAVPWCKAASTALRSSVTVFRCFRMC